MTTCGNSGVNMRPFAKMHHHVKTSTTQNSVCRCASESPAHNRPAPAIKPTNPQITANQSLADEAKRSVPPWGRLTAGDAVRQSFAHTGGGARVSPCLPAAMEIVPTAFPMLCTVAVRKGRPPSTQTTQLTQAPPLRRRKRLHTLFLVTAALCTSKMGATQYHTRKKGPAVPEQWRREWALAWAGTRFTSLQHLEFRRPGRCLVVYCDITQARAHQALKNLKGRHGTAGAIAARTP